MSSRSLPSNWIEVELKALVPSNGIFTDGDWVESKDQDPEGEVRLIQLADIGDGRFRNKSARFLTKAKAKELGCTYLQAGDILIARMPDPLGRACLFPLTGNEKYVTVVDVCVVRVAEETISSRFITYLINSGAIRQQIQGFESGTTRKRISGKNLARILIPLPPLAEQRRIVAKIEELFSELDKGIENLKQALAQLTVYRQALLKHAFEGHLTADWRKVHASELESADQLLASIRTERRRRWEEAQMKVYADSGKQPPKNWRDRFKLPNPPDPGNLPTLPVSWIWANLGECFVVEVGATPSRANPLFWNGTIPWVSSGEVQFCHVLETREKITEQGLANSSTQVNPVGSVILNMIGEGKTRGKAGVLKIAACNNQNCAAIWVSETSIPPLFIYYLLLFRYNQTRQLGSGNNQPAMNKSIVEQIAFPLAPQREQETIVQHLSEQLSVVDNLESDIDANLQKSEALRQSILKKAFAGELVPQDPNDEPASELLARIRAEREVAQKTSPAKPKKLRIATI
ncbi:MAG: Type restriction enzyme StySPI specificity protein [Pedosphaera sp.]|nr:Type restriction enzyme StySPI specificity protein [Pedosphaera sp.]